MTERLQKILSGRGVASRRAAEKMIADGIVPPVFMSANIDGGDAHNAKIFEEYKDNIFYM